jgi:hypothetical protein
MNITSILGSIDLNIAEVCCLQAESARPIFAARGQLWIGRAVNHARQRTNFSPPSGLPSMSYEYNILCR